MEVLCCYYWLLFVWLGVTETCLVTFYALQRMTYLLCWCSFLPCYSPRLGDLVFFGFCMDFFVEQEPKFGVISSTMVAFLVISLLPTLRLIAWNPTHF